MVLAKQVFKWAWRQGILTDYVLSRAAFPKAKAGSQPCFTSDQVERLIEAAKAEEKAALAWLAYGGLRIGQVEQLRWEDMHGENGLLAMIHVRRDGSNGSTKHKDDRFVPVHPSIASLLEPLKKKSGPVFAAINERSLLRRLKQLCAACGFDNPQQYKLHSFRHHFASLCANHQVAHRKALAWLGHSSSQMLDLYYHLHDEESKQAMLALARTGQNGGLVERPKSLFERYLRARRISRISGGSQSAAVQEVAEWLKSMAERVGFEPTVELPPQHLSRVPLSSAQSPLRALDAGLSPQGRNRRFSVYQ